MALTRNLTEPLAAAAALTALLLAGSPGTTNNPFDAVAPSSAPGRTRSAIARNLQAKKARPTTNTPR